MTAKKSVVARMDAVVNDFVRRCRYFHEPMTVGRARMFDPATSAQHAPAQFRAQAQGCGTRERRAGRWKPTPALSVRRTCCSSPATAPSPGA